MKLKRIGFVFAAAFVLGAAVLTGCDKSKGDGDMNDEQGTAAEERSHDSLDLGEEGRAKGESHAHAAPHGGIVKTIGSKHAELVPGDEGALTLYILSGTESEPYPIAASALTAQVKAEGEEGFTAVSLRPSPTATDGGEKGSRFQGELPEELHGKELVVTVTIPIEGKSYRAEFNIEGSPHEEHHEEEHESHDH